MFVGLLFDLCTVAIIIYHMQYFLIMPFIEGKFNCSAIVHQVAAELSAFGNDQDFPTADQYVVHRSVPTHVHACVECPNLSTGLIILIIPLLNVRGIMRGEGDRRMVEGKVKGERKGEAKSEWFPQG